MQIAGGAALSGLGQVSAASGTDAVPVETKEYWYTYDGENRILPYIPQAPLQKCGALSKVIAIVVQVVRTAVVSSYTVNPQRALLQLRLPAITPVKS